AGLAAADAAELGAEADGGRIAARFFHIIENVLAVLFAIGILDGGVDAGEDAEAVQAALDIGQLGGGERVAGAESDVAVEEPGAGGAVTHDQHLADELPLSLVNDE